MCGRWSAHLSWACPVPTHLIQTSSKHSDMSFFPVGLSLSTWAFSAYPQVGKKYQGTALGSSSQKTMGGNWWINTLTLRHSLSGAWGPQWDWTSVACSGTYSQTCPALAPLPLLSSWFSWNYLPNKWLALKSSSQDLILGESQPKTVCLTPFQKGNERGMLQLTLTCPVFPMPVSSEITSLVMLRKAGDKPLFPVEKWPWALLSRWGLSSGSFCLEVTFPSCPGLSGCH